MKEVIISVDAIVDVCPSSDERVRDLWEPLKGQLFPVELPDRRLQRKKQ